MEAREHAVISDLLAEHARARAITAEDRLAADWDREANRRRHETTRTGVRGSGSESAAGFGTG
jgi:hypothetical protein